MNIIIKKPLQLVFIPIGWNNRKKDWKVRSIMVNSKFNQEIKDVIDSIMLQIQGVVKGKMFGYPAYYINKKLIACIYEDGVGIKVPESLANELRRQEGITNFQPMGRRKMKEWIQINRENPKEFLKDIGIFEASVAYVTQLSKKDAP